MRVRAATISITLAAVAWLGAIALASGQEAVPGGWELPPTADTEKNPLTVTPVVLKTGQTLFAKKCERCHGPEGKGDGPDADPDAMADMDLTAPKRADRNPEGVVFYKIWNGRKKPKMPAFKEELTKDQAWSIVAYSQTLRQPAKK